MIAMNLNFQLDHCHAMPERRSFAPGSEPCVRWSSPIHFDHSLDVLAELRPCFPNLWGYAGKWCRFPVLRSSENRCRDMRFVNRLSGRQIGLEWSKGTFFELRWLLSDPTLVSNDGRRFVLPSTWPRRGRWWCSQWVCRRRVCLDARRKKAQQVREKIEIVVVPQPEILLWQSSWKYAVPGPQHRVWSWQMFLQEFLQPPC